MADKAGNGSFVRPENGHRDQKIVATTTATAHLQFTVPAGRDVAFWKSSMNPNFVSPKPGMDPMEMELIPVYRDELSKEKYITLTSAVMQNVGVRTQRVVQAQAEQAVRTMGQVEYAEPLRGDVTLKVDGWVEERTIPS